MARQKSKAVARGADEPVLFEVRPEGPARELYGRYMVVVSAHRRRWMIMVYPFFLGSLIWLDCFWFANDGVLPPSYGEGMWGSLARLVWPLMPVGSLLFIVGIPIGVILSCSERNFVRVFKKHGPDKGNAFDLNNMHLTRAGSRHPARVVACAERMYVEDTYEGILLDPEDGDGYANGRRAAPGKRWICFRYDRIVCAWEAPDLIVLRVCWGPGIHQVWDVIVDRGSFVQGDAEAFMRHVGPFFRFKQTSYRRLLTDARWSSPYASPNVLFKQRMTKLYRVRWPRGRGKEGRDGTRP